MLLVSLWLIGGNSTPDFLQDYAAARAWGSGLSVYSPTADLAAQYGLRHGFTLLAGVRQPHPPLATLLAAPLASMPFEQARLAWCVVSCLAIAGAWGVLKLSPLTCLASAPMWCVALVLGTHEPVVLLLLAVAVRCELDRPGLAAGLVGCAAALKLYPLVLLAPFLLRRQWGRLLAGGGVFAAGLLCGELLFHPGATRDWLEVTGANAAAYLDFDANLSLVRALREALGPIPGGAVALGLAAAMLAPWLACGKRAAIAPLLPIALLASPICWRHYTGLVCLQELNVWERACLALAGVMTLLVGAGALESAPDLLIATPLTLMLLGVYLRSLLGGRVRA